MLLRETVHIDLADPYEASMGGSIYLIIIVDSTPRGMRSYDMRRKSKTTMFVQKFLGAAAVGNSLVPASLNYATLLTSGVSPRPRVSRN